MWVRGLKPFISVARLSASPVAPHVGAWIETVDDRFEETLLGVAPHVGAWIETSDTLGCILVGESRTPCGCVD